MGVMEVKRFALLILVALGLSACTIRLDIGVEVNEDESGSFTVSIGLDEEIRELATQFGGEDLDLTEDIAGEVPEGFEVEEFAEDGFEGVRLSATFDSFDELNSQLEGAGGDEAEALGTDIVSNFGLTHDDDEFRFRADLTGVDEGLTDALSETGGDDLLSGFGAEQMADIFQVSFSLTLPGSIKEHNADTVNGNTLVWNISIADERGALEAVSSTAGGSSALLIGGAAAAAAALVGGGIALSRRRKKAAVDAVNSTPDGPVT
jgi:hypothetical protein